MSTAFLSLGSNLGDRRQNLTRALFYLAKEERIIIERISTFLSTKPYGVTDQPDFLNAAVRLYTDLSPQDLLDHLKAIEKAMGRTPSRHWGERNIDLDIILFDDLVLKEAALTIPHPDMANRRFVLQPLAEIAPDAVEPTSGKTIARLLAELE